MLGDIGEAPHLLVLCREIKECVEDDEHELEAALDVDVGEITHRDGDVVPARLGPKLGDHRLGGVNAGDVDAAVRERKGDASSPDREFEGRTAAAELRKQRDGCVDIEERSVQLVVDACDAITVGVRFVALHSTSQSKKMPPGVPGAFVGFFDRYRFGSNSCSRSTWRSTRPLPWVVPETFGSPEPPECRMNSLSSPISLCGPSEPAPRMKASTS